MKKHAYLIIAHNQMGLLKKLIELIDYKDNDIFLLIDKKNKKLVNDIFDIKNKYIKKSKIYIITNYKVYWGDYSQIDATLTLLEKATTTGEYEYYHYISGADLPLKSQNYIHEFFLKNNGKEFIAFDEEKSIQYIDRVKYYYFLQKYEKINIILLCINRILAKIQKMLRINRLKYRKIKLKKGSNWFSITDDCARFIISKKIFIEDMYKYSRCADEIFLQTIIEESEYKNNLYKNHKNDGNLRFIDWKRGNPYIWKKDDYDKLINSEHIFARKFNEDVDYEIVDMIYNYLKENGNEKNRNNNNN